MGSNRKNPGSMGKSKMLKMGANARARNGAMRTTNSAKSGKNETSTVDVHENKGCDDIVTEKKSGFLPVNSKNDENRVRFMSEIARITRKLDMEFQLLMPNSDADHRETAVAAVSDRRRRSEIEATNHKQDPSYSRSKNPRGAVNGQPSKTKDVRAFWEWAEEIHPAAFPQKRFENYERSLEVYENK